MDFFGYQEKARRHSWWLSVLFVLAVLLIAGAVYLAVVVGLLFGQSFAAQGELVRADTLWSWRLFAGVFSSTLLVILAGSGWRMYQLTRGGGAAVAEMLGGTRLPGDERALLYRRLLNVVEEMAIASGVPVPPVYILNQPGINAFAAGFTPADSVIGVTAGAVEILSRDELQGVIAHEFSHILNGDAQMKMRMMGMLHGITMISDFGIMLLTARSNVRYSSRERGSHPALLVIGMLLFLVGTLGLILADLIKSAISRQREYLADAAAVQFTRNPQGLAGALKVIGGYKAGARIRHAAVQQASHFFFGDAMPRFSATHWWASHPPLEYRIRRLDSRFQGEYEPVDARVRSSINEQQAMMQFSGPSHGEPLAMHDEPPVQAVFAAPEATAAGSMSGNISLPEAARLLARVPARLRDFAHDPFTARAVVYALLLNGEAAARKVQLDVLQKTADPNVLRETLDVQGEVAAMASDLRLPLAEMMLPTLKTLSREQYTRFRRCVHAMIKADHQVHMFEYAIHRLLLRHLDAEFGTVSIPGVRYSRAEQIAEPLGCLLAMLIRQGRHAIPGKVFAEAAAALGLENMKMPEERNCRMNHLDAGLHELAMAAPALKRDVLQACMQIIHQDGQVHVEEYELLRVIADGMDIPMPPLVLA